MVQCVLVRRCSVVDRNIGHRSWRTRRCELNDEHEVGYQHAEKLTVKQALVCYLLFKTQTSEHKATADHNQ